MNQRDMFDLFTMVFLLSIDHETQLKRLDTPDNADRNAAQRAQILEGRPTFERRDAGRGRGGPRRKSADRQPRDAHPPRGIRARTGGANPRIAPAQGMHLTVRGV